MSNIQECFDSAKWHYFLLFGLIFLLNPLCGIFLCLAYIVYLQDENIPSYTYITLFIFLSFWLGCINMTKFPIGDLPGYIRLFERVPQYGFYRTVFESWGGSGKEPFYSFITYIGYYICFGKASIFFFLLTSAMYFLLFMATFLFLEKIRASKTAILCGIISLAFFTQYFVLTSHIVRQMLAISIVMYAVVDRNLKGRNNWILLIIAVLTHTSAIFIALLSLIPFVYKKLGIKHIVILFFCFVPIILFNKQIGTLIGGMSSSIDVVQYAASRYSSNSGDGLAIPYTLILMVYVPLFIVSLRVLWLLRKEKEHPAYPIIYICLLLMMFVLSFSQNPLTQYRLFYFSYAFIPLLLPLMFYGRRKDYDQIYCLCAGSFFIVRFFLSHNTSGIQFASMKELVFMPFPYYFYSTFYY